MYSDNPESNELLMLCETLNAADPSLPLMTIVRIASHLRAAGYVLTKPEVSKISNLDLGL